MLRAELARLAVSGCGGLYKQLVAAAVVVASSDLQRVLGLARFGGCGASSDGEKRVRGLKAGRQGDQACTPARGSVRQL